MFVLCVLRRYQVLERPRTCLLLVAAAMGALRGMPLLIALTHADHLHTSKHAYALSLTHSHSPTSTSAHVHTHMHMHTHTRTCTHTCTHAHTHTDTCTHMHGCLTQSRLNSPPPLFPLPFPPFHCVFSYS